MAMNPVGEWWNSPAMASMSSPLSGYADRMRAAMASAPAVDPLVAAYTPPAYQTTKPHVDVNAIIAAMRGDQNTGGGSAAPAVVVIPQGGDANVGGADRAVGGLPNMQEFRDAASSGKAAFGGLLSAMMGDNPDFQTGGLTMDTVGAGGGSVGPGTGSNSDPVGGQNSSNEPMGKGGYAKGGEVTDVTGPNPPGPDDGVAALDKGEFVIRKDAAKALGTAALKRLNAKDPDVVNAVKRVIAGLEKRDASRGVPMVRDKDNDAQ